MTDVDRKTKNIVVRCLRPYKGYGLLRERGMLRGCAYLFGVRVVEYVCMGGYKDHVGCQ